jgi:hypothetical protein
VLSPGEIARGGHDVTDQFITGPPGVAPRADADEAPSFATDRKAVMVIYGHDVEAKDALFGWLRAIGLQPKEWSQLVSTSGSASPYIGQVLDHAFQRVQAVIALFTPDERGRRVPPEQWIWSPAETHPAIVTRATWDAAQEMSEQHATSRDDLALSANPQARRTYLLRGRVRCRPCKRRMYGITRPSTRYYAGGADVDHT